MSVVFAFGNSADGQLGNGSDKEDSPPICMAIPRGIKIVEVSAGSRHTLLLTSNGAVYSFGWGVLGQLGLGHCHNALTPTKVDSLSNVVKISAGGMHSGCIDADHRCYTWGSNGYGQLGLISTIEHTLGAGGGDGGMGQSHLSQGDGVSSSGTRQRVFSGVGMSVPPPPPIEEGDAHCRANSTSSTNSVFPHMETESAADDAYRLQHSSDSAHQPTPPAPAAAKPHRMGGKHRREYQTSVGSEDWETMVLIPRMVYIYRNLGGGQSGGGAESRSSSMGSNSSGSSGESADSQPLSSVTPFLAKSISCGGMHSAAVDVDGGVWCWGRADSGQVGFATKKLLVTSSMILGGTIVPTPFHVKAIEGRGVAVSCGAFHTCIVSDTGQCYSMGKDDFGMLGTSPGVNNILAAGTDKPTIIDKLRGVRVVDVSCGGWHTAFRSESGEIYSCGKGEYGRLGLGSEQSANEPSMMSLKGNSPSTGTGTGGSNKTSPRREASADSGGAPLSRNSSTASSVAGPGERMVRVTCGGSHTMTLTEKNQIFSCGRSDSGRLGLNQQVLAAGATAAVAKASERVRTLQPLSLEDLLKASTIVGSGGGGTGGVSGGATVANINSSASVLSTGSSPEQLMRHTAANSLSSSAGNSKPNNRAHPPAHSPPTFPAAGSVASGVPIAPSAIAAAANLHIVTSGPSFPTAITNESLKSKTVTSISAGGAHSLIVLNDTAPTDASELLPFHLLPTYLLPGRHTSRVSRSSSFSLVSGANTGNGNPMNLSSGSVNMSGISSAGVGVGVGSNAAPIRMSSGAGAYSSPVRPGSGIGNSKHISASPPSGSSSGNRSMSRNSDNLVEQLSAIHLAPANASPDSVHSGHGLPPQSPAADIWSASLQQNL